MPNFMFLNGPTSSFQLPATVDPEAVRTALKDAMRAGSVVDVTYDMGGQPAVVSVNGAALSAAGVVEIQAPFAAPPAGF